MQLNWVDIISDILNKKQSLVLIQMLACSFVKEELFISPIERIIRFINELS